MLTINLKTTIFQCSKNYGSPTCVTKLKVTLNIANPICLKDLDHSLNMLNLHYDQPVRILYCVPCHMCFPMSVLGLDGTSFQNLQTLQIAPIFLPLTPFLNPFKSHYILLYHVPYIMCTSSPCPDGTSLQNLQTLQIAPISLLLHHS